jgi:hypothetical protein
VGLSIAIGSHQLKIKREDLPKTEKHKSKMTLKVKILKLKFKIKMSMNKSLRRLENTAQIDDELASQREPHQEISKNDIKPIPSQPKNLIIKVLVKMKNNIKR